MRVVSTTQPSKCHLWTKDKLNPEDFYQLKVTERYLDEDHHKRQLMRCADCGQHYYKEFYETIDWVNGNDPQYRTYIPIKPTPDNIKKLNALNLLEIHHVSPRLLDDWPSDGPRKIHWIGRNIPQKGKNAIDHKNK